MKVYTVLMVLLLIPLISCSTSLLYKERQNFGLINDSDEYVRDVFLEWGDKGSVGNERKIPPGGTGHGGFLVNSLYYLPATITVRWVNAKGEKKAYEVEVKKETFPVLEKGQKHTFEFSIYQEHATLIATRSPRKEIDRIAYQADMAKREKRYKRFKAREKERLRPHLEKARQKYVSWGISNISYNGNPIFDYIRGNVAVKLMIIDYKEDGESAASTYLGDFRIRKRFDVTKGLTKILDIRVLPGQLPDKRKWGRSLTVKRGQEYGFEVRIQEIGGLNLE